MKNQKGITLITLAVTVIIMIVLTFTIAVNVEPYLNERRKTNFETDIKKIKEEVDQYYAREKSLPIINKYTNISMLEEIKNENDSDNEYYVIDLKEFDIELKYGSDYLKIKKKNKTEEINDLSDVYIINKQSHTIYYPKGIQYDGVTHYRADIKYTTISNIMALEEAKGYNLNKSVNKPEILTGMTPIKFTVPTVTSIGEVKRTNEEDEQWYEYGKTYTTRKWANAQTEDGSMWVWIPRYAYKITYYTDETKTTVSSTKTSYGSIDVVFLIGTTDNYYKEDGSIGTAQRQTQVNQTIDTTLDYTVHPAFTNESSINYANGGWDKELTGIWVAKFEAGYASGNNTAPVRASSVNYTQTASWVKGIERGTDANGNVLADGSEDARNWLDGIYGSTTTAIKYPTFQGTTYSINYINHNDSYNIARVLTEEGNIYGLDDINADSHMMKNSEWGAVSYLSQSIYGINGVEITVNNVNLNSGSRSRTEEVGKTQVDSVYAITGCTSNTIDTGENKTTIFEINSLSGDMPTLATDELAGGIYVWNQITGQNASTTGTIYGIYDMSGGAWERTSSYVANGNNALKTYGKSIAYENDALRLSSTKYTTVYPYKSPESSTIDTSSQNNFANNTKIYGDSVRETTLSNAGTSSSGWNSSSWNRDFSYFPALNGPFFLHGGGYWGASSAGAFAFHRTEGGSNYTNGFRAVLVAE